MRNNDDNSILDKIIINDYNIFSKFNESQFPQTPKKNPLEIRLVDFEVDFDMKRRILQFTLYGNPVRPKIYYDLNTRELPLIRLLRESAQIMGYDEIPHLESSIQMLLEEEYNKRKKEEKKS